MKCLNTVYASQKMFYNYSICVYSCLIKIGACFTDGRLLDIRKHCLKLQAVATQKKESSFIVFH